MLFVLMAVLGGLGVGFLLGGSLHRLEATSLGRVRLLVAGLVVQVLGVLALSRGWYAAALVVSFVLALAFLAGNPQLEGRGLIGTGLGLNALVITVNGAMPVTARAATSAGLNAARIAADPRHVLAGHATRLAFLADRIPLHLPVQAQVLSVGDVLVAAGAALMVSQAMRRRVAAPAPVRVRPVGSTGVRPKAAA